MHGSHGILVVSLGFDLYQFDEIVENIEHMGKLLGTIGQYRATDFLEIERTYGEERSSCSCY